MCVLTCPVPQHSEMNTKCCILPCWTLKTHKHTNTHQGFVWCSGTVMHCRYKPLGPSTLTKNERVWKKRSLVKMIRSGMWKCLVGISALIWMFSLNTERERETWFFTRMTSSALSDKCEENKRTCSYAAFMLFSWSLQTSTWPCAFKNSAVYFIFKHIRLRTVLPNEDENV